MNSVRSTTTAPPLLALGALGVVFGDIGTSPLYALHTAFSMDHNPVSVTPANVYGIISLVLWTITLIVTLKYVLLLTRADNQGQGGILALVALLRERFAGRRRMSALIAGAGMLGAALFYGDVLITPAISVLSATEGLAVIAPGLERLVLPVSAAVLLLIFAVQPLGTGMVGRAFGPVMLVWFLVLAGLGLPQIIAHPQILQSLSPLWALRLIIEQPLAAFILLGAVVLTVTGAEALYADMGHFGARPVQLAWFLVVLPALFLTYLGQGALVINNPAAVANPLFHLAPASLQIPLLILATLATVIASQAVISGAYSMTRQALLLNLVPRMVVRHTSVREEGQIYLPMVNSLLFIGVMALMFIFRSSARLANAYGLAVTGTLVLVSLLFLIYAHSVWRWAPWKLGLFGLVIGVPELLLLASSSTKLLEGGWLPLLIAAVLIVIMRTWQWGSGRILAHRQQLEGDLRDFLAILPGTATVGSGIHKVAGLAVFPHSDHDTTPLALVRCVRDLRLLHRDIAVVRVVPENVPHVPPEESAEVEVLQSAPVRVTRIDIRVGYLDDTDIPRRLALLGLAVADATYVLSALSVRAARSGWRQRLFQSMYRNQATRTEAFRLPPDRTIALGTELRL